MKFGTGQSRRADGKGRGVFCLAGPAVALVAAVTIGGMVVLSGCAGFNPGRTNGGVSQTTPRADNQTGPQKAAPELQSTADALSRAYAHFVAGMLALQDDDLPGAYAEFTSAALLDPTNEQLVADVAEYYIRTRQPLHAIPVLTNALVNGSRWPQLRFLLGMAYASAGKTNQAIDTFAEAAALTPGFWPAHRELFKLYLSSGRFNSAERVLQRAAKSFASDPAALTEITELWLGLAISDSTHAKRARTGVNQVLSVLGQFQTNLSTQLKLRIADAHAALGNHKTAIAWYTNVLGHGAGSEFVRDTIRLKLVGLYQNLGDISNAMAMLNAILNDSPDDPITLFNLGRKLVDLDRPSEAVRCFEQVLERAQDFEPAHLELARALLINNEPARALVVLGKARERFGVSFATEFFAGLASVAQKDYTNALKHFTEAEIIYGTLNPGRTNALLCFQLGAAFERLGNLRQAEHYLKLAISADPNLDEALNYLGYTWAEHGTNLIEAKRLIARALKLSPNNAAYLDSMGWVLFKLGRPAAALRYLEKAAALATEPDPTILDHLGDVYHRLGRYRDAATAWKHALELEPNQHIRTKLESLKQLLQRR